MFDKTALEDPYLGWSEFRWESGDWLPKNHDLSTHAKDNRLTITKTFDKRGTMINFDLKRAFSFSSDASFGNPSKDDDSDIGSKLPMGRNSFRIQKIERLGNMTSSGTYNMTSSGTVTIDEDFTNGTVGFAHDVVESESEGTDSFYREGETGEPGEKVLDNQIYEDHNAAVSANRE